MYGTFIYYEQQAWVGGRRVFKLKRERDRESAKSGKRSKLKWDEESDIERGQGVKATTKARHVNVLNKASKRGLLTAEQTLDLNISNYVHYWRKQFLKGSLNNSKSRLKVPHHNRSQKSLLTPI